MSWSGVQGEYEAPYVYLICSLDVVYIGETQKHPVIRWGSHLAECGSFRKRLVEKGDPDLNYLENLYFLCVSCDWIKSTFPRAQWKTATQALEHALHEEMACDTRIIGQYFRVISDTEKTAPRGFHSWSEVKMRLPKTVSEFRAAFEVLSSS